MPSHFFFRAAAAALIAAAALASHAQMSALPAGVATRVQALGPVINPPETAKIYAPLQPALTPAEAGAERDIAYGPDARHRLDVIKPVAPGATAVLRPVFLFVHGGGFVAGNKTAPGSPFYDNIMLWAARSGMVGVNMTYRLAPQNPWPAARDDLGLAVQWIGANIARFGGDPKRIVIAGHSAGATHVATFVADPASLQKAAASGARIAGAVMVSGLYDLPALPAMPPVQAYFGADAQALPARSPQPGLLAMDMPVLIATAELDPPEFRAQYKALGDALCQRGRCPVRLDLAGHSHMSEIYSIGTADLQLTDAMAAFVAAAR